MKFHSLLYPLTPPVQTRIPNPNDGGKICLWTPSTGLVWQTWRVLPPTARYRRGEALEHFPRPFLTRLRALPIAGLFAYRLWKSVLSSSRHREHIPTHHPSPLFRSSSLICAPLCFSVPCVIFRWRRHALHTFTHSLSFPPAGPYTDMGISGFGWPIDRLFCLYASS